MMERKRRRNEVPGDSSHPVMGKGRKNEKKKITLVAGVVVDSATAFPYGNGSAVRRSTVCRRSLQHVRCCARALRTWNSVCLSTCPSFLAVSGSVSGSCLRSTGCTELFWEVTSGWCLFGAPCLVRP